MVSFPSELQLQRRSALITTNLGPAETQSSLCPWATCCALLEALLSQGWASGRLLTNGDQRLVKPQHRTCIDRHCTQVRGCCIQEHVTCLEGFCDEGLQCSIQSHTKNSWASWRYEHLSTRESDMLPREAVEIPRMPPKHKINTWEKVKPKGYQD